MVLDAIIKTFASVAGLGYGGLAYVAPSWSFGPNGMFPLYLKTSVGEELDPVSAFYMRLHGMIVLFLILTYLLFVQRDIRPVKRAYLKMLLVGHITGLLAILRVMSDKDFDQYYPKRSWGVLVLVAADLIIWYTSIWISASKVPLIVPPNEPLCLLDKLGLPVITIYTAYFSFTNFLYGPAPVYWNVDEFDLVMKECSYLAGSALVALFFLLMTEALNMPTFTWKMLCFFMLLCLPLNYKQLYDTSGYAVQSAFAGDYAVNTVVMFLAFYRLGAFQQKQQYVENGYAKTIKSA